MRIGSVGAAAAAVALLASACRAQPAPAHHAAPASPVRASTAGTGTPTTATAPLPQQVVHRVPNHCAHNRAAQKVIVSIKAQHLWMCARHHLVRQTAVTTGMAGQWTSTPTGNFVVQGRVRNTTLTLNTGATYAVKYWIPFEGPLFGFHDSSWQTFPYGSAAYKTAGSHGCVHMPLKAIAFLYRWSERPTAVHIS